MRTDRVRLPAQDSRKRGDEEAVVKRHVYEERAKREEKEAALDAEDARIDGKADAAIGTNTNQAGLLQALRTDITTIETTIGSGGDPPPPRSGIKGDIHAINQTLNTHTGAIQNANGNAVAAQGDANTALGRLGQTGATTVNKQLDDLRADVVAMKADIRTLNEFMNRPAKFAAAMKTAGADVPHDH